MPKNIQKSLQGYLSKIKNSPSNLRLPSRRWINLKGCKHPRTPSFSIDDKPKKNTKNTTPNKDDEATLDDIDRFLFENFKSLYLGDHNEENNDNAYSKSKSDVFEKEKKYSKFDEPSPLNLYGSNGYYARRGFSGSMIDTRSTSTDEIGSSSSTSTNGNSLTPKRGNGNDADPMVVPDNCVVLLANSGSPYDNFRESMQEIVDARMRNNERVDWEFMQELLFCYINLNEKKSCKFILSAFVDLVTVMQREEEEAAPAKPRSVRTVKSGR